MALKAYPLNDTDYTAEDAQLYTATRTSGVYADNHFNISITGTDNDITIKPGLGWMKLSTFQGIAVANTEDVTINAGISDPLLPRIDAVVYAYGVNANAPEIIIKRGETGTTPTPPSVVRDDFRHELHLYHIRRRPGATAITAGDITDLRMDSNYCGLMADSVTRIDTDAISAQVQALAKELWLEIQSVKNGSAYLMRSGGTMTGPINMNGKKIRGLGAPTSDDEAVNWGSVKDMGKVSSDAVTLAAGGWVNNLQTVSVGGLTADAAVIVSADPSNHAAYVEAGVYCYEQGDGTLTFRCEDVPADSLSVNVVILSASGASAAYPAAEGGSF